MTNFDEREIILADFDLLTTNRDKISYLLEFATIAPSTHNSQPWKFTINNSSCTIKSDSELTLKHADPELKYMAISLGACLENLVLAATYFGVYSSYRIISANKSGIEIKISFKFTDPVKNKSLLEVLRAMLRRRNARGLFTNKIAPKGEVADVLNQLKEQYVPDCDTVLSTTRIDMQMIGRATQKGLAATYKSRDFRLEMSKWMHNSLTHYRDGMPGYALRMPFLLSFILPTVIKYLDIGSILGYLNYISIKSAPYCVSISTESTDLREFIEIGRFFEIFTLRMIAERNYYSSVYVASLEEKTLEYERMGHSVNPCFLFVVGEPQHLSTFTPRHSVNEKQHG